MRSSTAAAATAPSPAYSHAAAADSPPTAAAHGRSKRWASHSDQGQYSDQEQEMDDLDEDQPKPRSKRARGSNASSTSSSRSTAANGTAKGSSSSTLTSGTGSSAPVSANDKEQRKQARMIRNRNAAQASRDRKKEHTQWLETRVQQLEAQLNLAPSSSGFAPSPSASASVVAPTTTGPRSNRSNSISSLASTTPRVAELEEENEVLRVQLHSEQMETARLRGRLESLEDKFSRFEQFMAAPLSTAAVDPLALPPSPSAFISHTTTPAPFEPTFSYDTIKAEDEDDLTLLPIVAHSSTTAPQVEPSPASPSSMSNSSRLVARELVEETLSSPPTPPPGVLHLDDYTVASAWGDWANGLAVKTEEHSAMEADDLTTEYLDFSYLQDLPSRCSSSLLSSLSDGPTSEPLY